MLTKANREKSLFKLLLVCCFCLTSSLAAAQNKKKAKPPKDKVVKAVGTAVGGNTATPVDLIKATEGFKVELLYSVPSTEQGSWVNLCTDDKGRLLVSDQFGGLYRITPPAAGRPVDIASVEKVPAAIRAVNGMVWSEGALYVGVNDYERKMTSGLYRISDSNGDDQLDMVELLRAVNSRSDHGVHAVVPTADGEGFFLITGNNTAPPELADTSPVPQIWGEDHLLPSMPDGRGHNRGVLAPGGIVYRVTENGTKFEAYASGFRNIFDAAVNSEGSFSRMTLTWNTTLIRLGIVRREFVTLSAAASLGGATVPGNECLFTQTTCLRPWISVRVHPPV